MLWLSFGVSGACQQVDRLHKEKEPYIAEAAAFLRAEVASSVPQILQQVCAARPWHTVCMPWLARSPGGLVTQELPVIAACAPNRAE